MTTAVQAVVAVIAASVLPGALFGQSSPNEPIKTTLCELVKQPASFAGMIVQFRAEYVAEFYRTGFVDKSCGGIELEMGLHHVLDELRPGIGQYALTEVADEQSEEFRHFERLQWKTVEPPLPVRLVEDNNYRDFRKYVDAHFRWKDGGTCRNCPLFRTTVTAVGRFDYFWKDWLAVRTEPTATPYIWGPGGPLMRFVLQAVSDVTASPIDPSAYSQSGRRYISAEEASDLVCVLTGGCEDGSTSLMPPDQKPDSGFYHFDAWNSISHVGFFDVDARTGDVWSGVICEQLDSPSLVRLQRTIRKRIGMPDKEYKEISKTGPICEPGEKARVSRWK